MPIVTLSPPSKNSARNVTVSTRNFMVAEFRRAAAVCSGHADSEAVWHCIHFSLSLTLSLSLSLSLSLCLSLSFSLSLSHFLCLCLSLYISIRSSFAVWRIAKLSDIRHTLCCANELTCLSRAVQLFV